ncbi:pyruvate dehydrogenase (acetyl-transferring) kinase, mitochondrial isoform X1 [Lepeophtheirus salmonis]|uniref:pyruvate dehydrogenase (acetyl-transferring) kinase, mitochondrial isoform X1 n=1 Tax=Lepeophtheirus salmonis TaxID=72036 RepID=UPI001AE5092F|nr:pyruvate dehydrogenase (acetyl-transferring) kinase, mitochondrial-like isoform X1 [Lepeophtheirus salmonis]XP_040575958.1 pyruvate dehydrogenase (acetyl-transferring) kinase, mitochondrial-like isoform X1 [Lepeophtheirus salmonis]
MAKMRFSPATKNITKLMDIKSLKLLDHFASFNPSPLSIGQFLEFGRNATESDSFHFLIKEAPVRMSNIMKEINLLPSNLLQIPSIVELQGWYAQSFKELCAYEGCEGTSSILQEFQKSLDVIQKRHSNVVQTMAQGVLELKESHSVDLQTEMSIQYFLDRFYMSRISLKMLMTQHMLLFERDGDEAQMGPNYTRVGCIETECKVRSVVMDAYNHASFLCEEYYHVAPDVNITLATNKEGNPPLEMVYPPQHLHHILFELFKNAMRAVVEKNKTGDIPDIEILIALGQHDITIKISDQGGGIPRSVTDHLFHYLFSTAPRPSMTPTKTPLAGYGYGLPLSRLYARYFHGDLILNSYDGYGTDAVVYLKTHTYEANELLPVFNKTSTKQYKASVPTADWTDPTSSINRHFHPHMFSTKSYTNKSTPPNPTDGDS